MRTCGAQAAHAFWPNSERYPQGAPSIARYSGRTVGLRYVHWSEGDPASSERMRRGFSLCQTFDTPAARIAAQRRFHVGHRQRTNAVSLLAHAGNRSRTRAWRLSWVPAAVRTALWYARRHVSSAAVDGDGMASRHISRCGRASDATSRLRSLTP